MLAGRRGWSPLGGKVNAGRSGMHLRRCVCNENPESFSIVNGMVLDSIRESEAYHNGDSKRL
jgi:hypothetical protein